jgi:hypothetical protein
MKKREATHLHPIKKKAAVRDGDAIVPGDERTKVTAFKARGRTAIPDPAVPSRKPDPEEPLIKTIRKTTAGNPETGDVRNPGTGDVPDAPILPENSRTGRTLKKTQEALTAGAKTIAPKRRVTVLKPGVAPAAAGVAGTVENLPATSSRGPNRGGMTDRGETPARSETMARGEMTDRGEMIDLGKTPARDETLDRGETTDLTERTFKPKTRHCFRRIPYPNHPQLRQPTTRT